jgi:hypothetical protein
MFCKHCHKSFAHPNLQAGRSPFSLTRHIKDKKCPVSVSDQAAGLGVDLFHTFFTENAIKREVKSQAHITEENITECVLDWFISGDIPFAQADNPHFKKLISMIRIPKEKNPSRPLEEVLPTTMAHGPSRKVLRSRLNRYYTTSESTLKEELLTNDSKLSIALDLWTGGTNYAFMGIFLLSGDN